MFMMMMIKWMQMVNFTFRLIHPNAILIETSLIRVVLHQQQ